MKRFACFALFLSAACAAPLATLPPSDTYTVVESPAPSLTPDEQRLVDAINKEFDRLGLPTATVGGYESNVAAIMANVALAKIWHGSGRAFATNNDVAAPSSDASAHVLESKKASASRVNSLTDEEDDAELKHLHPAQHQISYGIEPLQTWVFSTPLAKTALEDDDIKKLARVIRPKIKGEAKLGVAILPTGDADLRIWVAVLRVREFELTRGPPRAIAPGGTFPIAGVVIDKNITELKLGVLGPDGKVELSHLSVDGEGRFATNVTLPAAPGLYTFGLDDARGSTLPFAVPIFAGVDPTPWPVSADPKAVPVDGTRALAQRLAKTLTDYRRDHGLSAIPFDVDLSAFSKSEATVLAGLTDGAAGPGSGDGIQGFVDGWRARASAAGFEHLAWWENVAADDYLNNYFARFPYLPFYAASIASPTAQAFGIGVALVPNTVTKDDDLTRYAFIVTVKKSGDEKEGDSRPAGAAGTDKAVSAEAPKSPGAVVPTAAPTAAGQTAPVANPPAANP